MDNEIVIDIKLLAYKIVKQFKKILIFSLIIGIIAGGYGIIKYNSVLNDSEKLAKEEYNYSIEMLSYETKGSSLDAKITYNSEELVRLQEYNNNSLLMKIDPYNECVSSFSLL